MTINQLPGATQPPAAGPRVRLNTRQHLLDTIRREGGEWTVGRAKPVLRRFLGGHIYRATIRRHLRHLEADGHLIEHGNGTPRRYYTPENGR